MTVLSAYGEGWRRVWRAPIPVLGLTLVNLFIAFPYLMALTAARRDWLGLLYGTVDASVAWDHELLAQAAAVGQSLAPALIGVAVMIRPATAGAEELALVHALSLAIVLLTALLYGGTLDRLARDRRTGSAGFFAAAGLNTLRLLRLAALAAALYAAALWVLGLVPAAARFPAGVALLLGINLLVDYTAIRVVVEDRHSVLGACAAAMRFLRRHFGAAAALAVLHAALVAAALLIFTIHPLVYVVVRLVLRLAFAAAQITLFQSRLAHAGYTARPLARWPDSAAAEAVRALSD